MSDEFAAATGAEERLRDRFGNDAGIDYLLTNLGNGAKWMVVITRKQRFPGDTPDEAVEAALESVSQEQLNPCVLGASAFHLNSGERWVVIGQNADTRDLLIRLEGGDTERWVHRDYWLGESWADR